MVANELIDHFQEGLVGGREGMVLVETFGDPKQAAKLIRRAKIRCRSWLYHVLVRFRQAVGVAIVGMLLLYVVLTPYYLIGSPEPKVDYIAMLNQRALAFPEREHAWPLYRQAMLKLTPFPAATQENEFAPIPVDRLPLPQDEQWHEAEAYLKRHSEVLTLLEQASRRATLGLMFENELLVDKPEPWPRRDTASVKLPSRRGSRIGLQPYWAVGVFPDRIVDFVLLDGRQAAQHGNADRVLLDFHILARMARHFRNTTLYEDYLISLRPYQRSLDFIAEVLAEYPTLLSDSQLQDLAHEIVELDSAVDLSAQEWLVLNALQRIYTDDGGGDGRLTMEGILTMRSVHTSTSDGERWLFRALLVPLSLTVMSRQDVLDEYHKFVSASDADFSMPLWQMDMFADAFWAERYSNSTFHMMRRAPVIPFIYSSDAVRHKEYAFASRDAVLTAIALQLYHRRTGHWPKSLEELVPHLLPKIPPDRFDGKPLRYALIDDKPMLYSVGTDRVDDGGRLVFDKQIGKPRNDAAREWIPTGVRQKFPEIIPRGDWVLWPVPRD